MCLKKFILRVISGPELVESYKSGGSVMTLKNGLACIVKTQKVECYIPPESLYGEL